MSGSNSHTHIMNTGGTIGRTFHDDDPVNCSTAQNKQFKDLIQKMYFHNSPDFRPHDAGKFPNHLVGGTRSSSKTSTRKTGLTAQNVSSQRSTGGTGGLFANRKKKFSSAGGLHGQSHKSSKNGKDYSKNIIGNCDKTFSGNYTSLSGQKISYIPPVSGGREANLAQTADINELLKDQADTEEPLGKNFSNTNLLQEQCNILNKDIIQNYKQNPHQNSHQNQHMNPHQQQTSANKSYKTGCFRNAPKISKDSPSQNTKLNQIRNALSPPKKSYNLDGTGHTSYYKSSLNQHQDIPTLKLTLETNGCTKPTSTLAKKTKTPQQKNLISSNADRNFTDPNDPHRPPSNSRRLQNAKDINMPAHTTQYRHPKKSNTNLTKNSASPEVVDHKKKQTTTHHQSNPNNKYASSYLTPYTANSYHYNQKR